MVFLRRGEAAQPAREAPVPHGERERRILVVANETVGGRELLDCVEQKSEGVAEKVLVVCPALNTPLRHWVSDEDEARDAAQRRLDESLASMRAAGIDVSGEIGDGDPLQAIEDAVRTFGPTSSSSRRTRRAVRTGSSAASSTARASASPCRSRTSSSTSTG